MVFYKIKNDTIIFNKRFNKSIDNLKQVFSTVSKIKFGFSFNKNIDILYDLSNITHIYFGCCFNQRIDYLPIKLQFLSLNECFDKPIDYLPKTLKCLILGFSFNQKINYLPDNLEYLTIGYKFNQNIDYLPKNIKHLYLDHDFNKNIDYLPKNLMFLVLGKEFNQNIDYLPNNLKSLTLGDKFNKDINHLPSINCLYIGDKFNKKLHFLPKSITLLSLLSYEDYQAYTIPRNCQYLYISNLTRTCWNEEDVKYDKYSKPALPEGLIELEIYNSCGGPVCNRNKIDSLNLPKNLKKLIFGPFCNFNSNVKYLPDNIEILRLNNGFNFIPSIEKFPINLKTLELRCSDGILYSEIFSTSIKNLILYTDENFEIRELPPTIEHLILPDDFNRRIIFPRCLKSLIIQENFKQELNNLPNSVERIIFYPDLEGNNLDNLPTNLKEIQIYSEDLNSIDFLPTSLEYLYIKFVSFPLINLPSGLNKLIIGGLEFSVRKKYEYLNPCYLPESIEYLALGFYIRKSFVFGTSIESFGKIKIEITKLPRNLKKLYISSEYEYLYELRKNFKNIKIIVTNSINLEKTEFY